MGNAPASVPLCNQSEHAGAHESLTDFAPLDGSSFHSVVDGPERMMTRMMTRTATAGPATDWHATGMECSSHSLTDLVTALEACSTMAVAKYRSLLKIPKEADEEELKKAEEAFLRVEKHMKSAQRLRSRQTWQGGEAETWMNMYMGSRKRFRSLKVIASRVQVENSIIRHWRQQRGTNYRPAVFEKDNQKLTIDQWDGMDVFQLERENQQPLTHVFMTIWKRRGLEQLCRTPEEKAFEFIRSIEMAYKENPYHNRVHAAEVTLTSYYLWSQLAAQQGWEDYFVEVDLLALLVSAAIHDVGHPAVNNDFMIKTRDDLALQYNDKSVLENYHAATAFKVMKDRGINLLEHNLPSPPPAALRTRVIDMVLATDMAFHKQNISSLQSEAQSNDRLQDIDKLVLEQNIVHMSDIAHPLRPMDQHKEWSRRCTEEFFAQGDAEKRLNLQPIQLFDRDRAPSLAKGQLGFLNFVVVPTWKSMRLVLGDQGAQPLDTCLKENMACWEAEAALEDEEPPPEKVGFKATSPGGRSVATTAAAGGA